MMNASTAQRPACAPAFFLAGLQAGMIGSCCMLAWLGLSAMSQGRSFWTAGNLMASVLHGGAAIRRGFGFSTLSGIALYLLIYSLLGAGFAMSVRNRLTGLGTVLVGVLFSVGWYWLWFRTLGQAAMPLVWLLHAENATVFGHVIFGVSIARFRAYLPAPEPIAPGIAAGEQPASPAPEPNQPATPAPAPEPAAESVPPDPDLS